MNQAPLSLLSQTCESLENSLRLLRQQIELWNTKSNLIVTMPDGMPIRMESANKTFLKVIELIGVERVYNVKDRPPSLISTEYRPWREPLGQYYVDLRRSNVEKAKILLRIANDDKLKIDLKVEIVMSPIEYAELKKENNNRV